jgi:hypothetical protein
VAGRAVAEGRAAASDSPSCPGVAPRASYRRCWTRCAGRGTDTRFPLLSGGIVSRRRCADDAGPRCGCSFHAEGLRAHHRIIARIVDVIRAANALAAAAATLEEAGAGVVQPTQLVVVDGDARDATVRRQHAGLRLDLLRSEDPADPAPSSGSRLSSLEIAGELLDPRRSPRASSPPPRRCPPGRPGTAGRPGRSRSGTSRRTTREPRDRGRSGAPRGAAGGAPRRRPCAGPAPRPSSCAESWTTSSIVIRSVSPSRPATVHTLTPSSSASVNVHGGLIQFSGLYARSSLWMDTDPSALTTMRRSAIARCAVSRPA